MAPTYRIAQFRGPKFLQISRITGHCEIIPMKILMRAVHLRTWTVFQCTHATASSMALFVHFNSEVDSSRSVSFQVYMETSPNICRC